MIIRRTDEDGTKGATPRVGLGEWSLIAVLLLILAATIVASVMGWQLGEAVDLPASTYLALALGSFLSLAVGIGLMALLFYSSRKGFDEPPTFVPQDAEAKRDVGSREDGTED